MSISVIIPAYNAAKTIIQTIESVINQTYKDFEIIVINDGSTDNTLEELKKIKAEIKIISTVNKGVSHARNLGLKHAKGKYIQYLDADDLLLPDKLEIQFKALEQQDGDVAYGNWQRFKEINQKINITETVERQLSEDIEIEIFTHFWCPPAVLLYSRRIAEKMVWNENLPVIQDARYFLDAALLQGKFVYCNNILALYREGQTQSLSQKSELSFVKDVFINCLEIYGIWKKDNFPNSPKEEAIINTLRYCINVFSTLDQKLFIQSIEKLLEIKSKYVPNEKGSLRFFSKLLGYKKAEQLASIKRKFIK